MKLAGMVDRLEHEIRKYIKMEIFQEDKVMFPQVRHNKVIIRNIRRSSVWFFYTHLS
jgi:hypothetical protein